MRTGVGSREEGRQDEGGERRGKGAGKRLWVPPSGSHSEPHLEFEGEGAEKRGSPSYLVRIRTLGPPLENNPEIPPSSRDEGLRLLHVLETNLATSLQTPQEA